jgi:hypothetical protein
MPRSGRSPDDGGRQPGHPRFAHHAPHAWYVYPETATKMVKAIESHRGKLEKITSSIELARCAAPPKMQDVSHDKHLRVVYREREIPVREQAEEFTPGRARADAAGEPAPQFGFEKGGDGLMGNVGYLEMRSFAQVADGAAEAATAAMNFLGNVDALIIDLRRNGGAAARRWWRWSPATFTRRESAST